MKTATYIVNWLIVCLCCLVGSAVMSPLSNHVVKRVFGEDALPLLSHALLYNPWILWSVVLVWGSVTGFFLLSKNSTEKMALHTSTSILLGLFVILAYAMGGMLPFIGIFSILHE